MTTTIFVDGSQRTPGFVPSPTESSCGNRPGAIRAYTRENFGWVEVKNPSDAAATVSLSVEQGAALGRLALFAYASATPPASEAELSECLAASSGGFEPNALVPFGPALSAANGRGLVIPPRASAYVMLATDQATGAFQLKARTEGLGVADVGSLTVANEGATKEVTVLVSGAARTASFLAMPGESSCGNRARAVRSYNRENFAYVEVKNPANAAAMVRLDVEGPDLGGLAMFAYASPTPPKADEELQCLAASNGAHDRSTFAALGPSLSNGNALVVPPRASVYVMLATAAATGAFKLKARTEKMGGADVASLSVPSSGAAQLTVLVSGAQRTASYLPSANSCGSRPRSVRSYDRENFAWVEVKNPTDGDAAVALSVVEGPNLGGLAMFAYASSSPPATDEEEDQCLTSSSGGWTYGAQTTYGPAFSEANRNSLVVRAHASAWVLLAAGASTGAFELKAQLE